METMFISVRLAAVSHLSDAQELLRAGFPDNASDHIDFAKLLLIEYAESECADERELSMLWKEMIREKGQTKTQTKK